MSGFECLDFSGTNTAPNAAGHRSDPPSPRPIHAIYVMRHEVYDAARRIFARPVNCHRLKNSFMGNAPTGENGAQHN